MNWPVLIFTLVGGLCIGFNLGRIQVRHETTRLVEKYGKALQAAVTERCQVGPPTWWNTDGPRYKNTVVTPEFLANPDSDAKWFNGRPAGYEVRE